MKNTLKTIKLFELKPLAPFLFICWLVGSYGTFPQTGGRKVFGIMLILFHISTYLHYITKPLGSFVVYIFIVLLVDKTGVLFLTLGCISSSISALFVNTEKFERIFNNYKSFKREIDIDVGRRNRSAFILGIVLELVAIFAVIGADAWLWITYRGIRNYKYYISRNVQIFVMDVTRITIHCLANEACIRMKTIGDSLGNISVPRQKADQATGDYKSVVKVKLLRQCFHNLCDTFEQLNIIYGIPILFDILSGIMSGLQYSILLLRYYFFEGAVVGINFGLNIKFVCFMWITKFCVSIIFFVY